MHKCAAEIGAGSVQESLKWGEPSFAVRGGSPFRFDWKEHSPDSFFVFFNCNTSLVATFREVFGSILAFEGLRAIVLSLDDELPTATLSICIQTAMEYRARRNLPLLGL